LKTVLNNNNSLVALLRPARHPRVRLDQLLLYIRAKVPVVSSCQVRETRFFAYYFLKVHLHHFSKMVRETKFFCLLLSEGTFTSFFKDKKS
jgi:hypothetical protein